jgi:hypothetical protein
VTPEPDGPGGLDALMAAITGEPLPDEARADDAFLARHRAATADVTLLREQLAVIADALTGPVPQPVATPAEEPATAPVRPLWPPRRRLLPLALQTVGVAAAGALFVGLGWLVVQSGGSASDSGAGSTAADQKAAGPAPGGVLGDPGYLACARLVVEGDVTAVVPVSGSGGERVTLRVTRSYKPQRARKEVDFVMGEDMDPLLGEGDHVLVALAKGSASPDVWAVGEAEIAPERAALSRALPEAEGLGCE